MSCGIEHAEPRWRCVGFKVIQTGVDDQLGISHPVSEGAVRAFSLWYGIAVSSLAPCNYGRYGECECDEQFVSHLFLANSKVSESEKRVGNILAVSESDLPKADYLALGHIHRSQKIGENTYYSGAITALSVKEKNLSVEIVESESGKVKNVRRVKLNNVSRYETVNAKSIEEARIKLENFDDKDLVELVITQSQPLSATSVKEIKKNFPCVSTISLVLQSSDVNAKSSEKSRKLLSDDELFKQFYYKTKGISPSEELVSLFLDCKGGLDEADNS